MKRLIIAAIVVMLICSTKAFAQTQGSIKKMPPVYVPRVVSIDVKHIALDLRFDWKRRQAFGTATVTLTPLTATNSISLDAGMLTINSVTLSNGTTLKFTNDGGDAFDGLKILLGRPYAANETITLVIDYHSNWINEADPNNLWGTFGKGLRFHGPTTTDPLRRKQIWSMGDPESNRYWFPCLESPTDLRTTECTLTVDSALTAISSGALVRTQVNTDGTRSFHWKADKAYANYLTSLVVGEYVDVVQNWNGISLHSYSYPDEVAATSASVARLPEMVQYFSEVTGVKYPYQRYSQVFVQDFAGFSGNHTVSTITENMVDDDRTHADFFFLWDLTEAETLARQWFGNYLPSTDWSNAWLNNSFSHFFNCLFNEHRNGKEEYLIYMRPWDLNTLYMGDWQSGNRHPIVTSNFENVSTFTSDNYSVIRGALVLHMLRKEIGDDSWWKAVKLDMSSNADKSVTTEDFMKAVETASGRKMDWFFNQWLYRMGHPVFEVVKSYDAAKKQLSLKVRQTQTVDPKDEYPQTELFEGRIAIEIDDRIEVVQLSPKAENLFTLSSPVEPKLVNFDYEGTWIKELTFAKTLDELLYQFENDRDIVGRQTAMTELVAIANDTSSQDSTKERIYAGFRNIITSKAYWRLRNNALGQLQGMLAPPSDTVPPVFNQATVAMLMAVMKNEKSWNRSVAIRFLGMSKDPKYADLYLSFLNDESDRVINQAAISLGKSKSPMAFDALAKLVKKPSWKNQSLISALYGLKELGDPRGFDIAFTALKTLNSPHWTLATPVWDYRMAAAMTIKSLGKSDAAFPYVLGVFKSAMAEDDAHGTFYNALLITTIADPRGQEVYELLKTKFKDDANAIAAADQLEIQFKATLGKK